MRELLSFGMKAIALALPLIATPTAGMIDFANNITDLAAKVEPAQVQVIQDIIHKALPSSN